MNALLKIEELGLLLFGVFLFEQTDLSWWWFFGLILTPDIGMLGYLFGNRVGAYSYNLFHHRGVAIFIYLIGLVLFRSMVLEVIGIIMFSHIAMDRVFGYGLKYNKGFKFTHLGEVGK